MIKKFKPFIGKPIYTIPTGNNVRKGTPLNEQIKKVTLLKVGNKLLTTLSAYGEESYAWDGTYNAHNYGQMHFTTRQEAEEHFTKQELEAQFRNAFQYGSTNFSFSALELAWSILNDKRT